MMGKIKITKIRINMHDAFSHATDSREFQATPELLKKVEHAQINGIIQNEFSNGIRWNWVIDEVEILD